MHRNWFEAEIDIRRISMRNGYKLGMFEKLPNQKHQVCTFVWKIMHWDDAMDYEHGINYDSQGFAADHWCDTQVKYTI